MPLGMEAGLGPGHIVLDRDPAPLPQKGAQPPIFGLCLLWPNGWMDKDATWYEGRPGHNVLHGDPAPPKRDTAPPPIFGACLLWPNGCPSQLLLSICIYVLVS